MTDPVLAERGLWASVLDQAIDDLSHKNDYLQDKARTWFTEDKRNFSNELCDIEGCDPQIGSFIWICMILGLNAEKMREAILVRTL